MKHHSEVHYIKEPKYKIEIYRKQQELLNMQTKGSFQNSCCIMHLCMTSVEL